MGDIPLSARWVSSFVESLNRAVLEDICSWELLPTHDPLRRVLHVRRREFWWLKEDIPFVRIMITQWAQANDCRYRRTSWKRYDLRSEIVLKGLGPLRDSNPFEE